MLLVPPFFVYLCVINEKEKQVAHFGAKIALCVMIFLIAGATIFAFNWGRYQNMNYFAALGNLYLDGYNSAIYIPLSCGLIGGILGYPVAALCGQPVAIILTILLLAVIIFIITNLSVKDVAKAATRATERIRRANEERAARRRERMEEEQRLEYGDNYSQPKRRKLRKQKQQPVNNSDIDVPIYMDGKRQNGARRARQPLRISQAILPPKSAQTAYLMEQSRQIPRQYRLRLSAKRESLRTSSIPSLIISAIILIIP